jgi:hypothetical protein
MATAQPDPSNGGTALTRTAAAPRQLTPPLHPQPDGLRLRYSALLSTGT